MARNEEKAMAMLNRWVRMKRELTVKPKDKRPTNISEIDSIPTCEKWRSDVMRDIIKKVSDIQNAALGEFKIRELNDDINRLLREKQAWEARIKELGGPDYQVIAPMMLDAEGEELPNSQGYKYFGAAKLLPRVRELFQKEAPAAPKISRKLLYKNISANYYGIKFESEENELLDAEKIAEQEAREKEIQKSKEKAKNYENAAQGIKKKKIESELAPHDDENSELEIISNLHKKAAFNTKNTTKTAEEEIKKILLERKKKALLDKYASPELQNSEKESILLLKTNK